MQDRLEDLYEQKEFSESALGIMATVIGFIVSFPIMLLGLIFNVDLETGGEKNKKEILKLKNEMGEDWFTYDEWKSSKQLKERGNFNNSNVEKKNWLGKLWENLKIIIGVLFIISMIVAFWTFIYSDTFSYFVVVVWPIIGGIATIAYLYYKKLEKKNDDKSSP